MCSIQFSRCNAHVFTSVAHAQSSAPLLTRRRCLHLLDGGRTAPRCRSRTVAVRGTLKAAPRVRPAPVVPPVPHESGISQSGLDAGAQCSAWNQVLEGPGQSWSSSDVSSAMDESALERYFDDSIANVSLHC